MQKGIIYNKLDCLDVLETLDDNTLSLIYLNVPEHIGGRSSRITYDESRRNPIAAFRRERGCIIRDFKNDEIQTFIKECKKERDREYEKYLFKIASNCFRVLKADGVIVYREKGGENLHADFGAILEYFFGKFAIRVVEPIATMNCRTGFDLLHFYSNKNDIELPVIRELKSEDLFPYVDERGKYRLLPILECARHRNNVFEWNGMLPREGTGWRYSKEKLDELNTKGYIQFGKRRPLLKCYREEHFVNASSIWSERNVLERILGLYTNVGDEVLGCYEDYRFALQAEKNQLLWRYVVPQESTETSLQGQQRLEGRYSMINSMEQYNVVEYQINVTLPIDIRKEKEEFYKRISKEYSTKKQTQTDKGIGKTTDEILRHHINKYLEESGMSESGFADLCGVSRQTISKIRSETNRENKAKRRDREIILNIAIYSQMSYAEARCALKGSGYDFIENPVEDAIVQWLCEESKNIDVLNNFIKANFAILGTPEEESLKYIYTPPKLTEKKNAVVDR